MNINKLQRSKFAKCKKSQKTSFFCAKNTVLVSVEVSAHILMNINNLHHQKKYFFIIITPKMIVFCPKTPKNVQNKENLKTQISL